MVLTNNNVNVNLCNYINESVPTKIESAVAGSGCTICLIKSSTPCEEKTPTVTGICVGITNGAIV